MRRGNQLRKLMAAMLALGGIDAVHADERCDIVIRGGRVVDGTGAPWYIGDVGIRAGKIVRVGRIADADGERIIDATGLVVAPGFVDMMGQTAVPMLDNPATARNLLTQGITTINAGEGHSPAPLSDEEASKRGWQTMAEYFQLLDLKGLPINAVQTVGHTQVRRMVLGDVDRRPTAAELKRMQEYVREAMEAGAIGVSTALIYPPAVFAQTEEIAALVAVAGEYGGRYFTHMRNEGDRLLEAIDEALEIGAAGKAPVHIFHLKAAGRQNWGKMQLAIAKIRAARAEGRQVTADIYPYINNGLGIAALIHPRHFAEGRGQLISRLGDPQLRAEIRKEIETTDGWENWYRHIGHDWSRLVIGQTDNRRYAEHAGKSLAEIAEAVGEDPWDTFFELVKSGAFALPESMTDANKILAMQQDFVSFCTDVGPAGGARIAAHPRAFGSFPRLLSRYVRELGAIRLERAVSQASASAANKVLAYDRGRIAEGQAADIIVFDEAKLADHATFVRPDAEATGMKYVLVNGQVVLDDGKMTRARPGRILRGPGYRPEKSSPAVSTGDLDPRLNAFDRMMRQFMADHRVPGAAIAVTDHGRLVLARGYGYADVAAKTPVRPESLFRIASISKPVTAVAILQLVERGKLKLDDRVFDILDEQSTIEDVGEAFDERQRAITVEHLLEHRGGWDREMSFDAMFQSVRFAEKFNERPPAGTATVIRAMMGQKLDFDPGQRYAYSNYGYCLLGRIIEERTGVTYEQFVRESVLAPLGIQTMRIGKTRREGRQPLEVTYYSPRRGSSVFADDLNEVIPHPYGCWHLEAMDSHGAWIASAVDLARFASAFDNPDSCPVLKAGSVKRMFQRPPGNAGHEDDGTPKSNYYSLGWMNRSSDGGRNSSHTGSLPGTATILIRRQDGRNLITLFNARTSPQASHFGNAVRNLLHNAADEVSEWPEGNLFD